MKRYLIIFDGRVQGVGFRYTNYKIAIKNNLVGSVKNLDNGMVETIIQGQIDNIDNFLNEILTLKGYHRIDEYNIKELMVDSNIREFLITY